MLLSERAPYSCSSHSEGGPKSQLVRRDSSLADCCLGGLGSIGLLNTGGVVEDGGIVAPEGVQVQDLSCPDKSSKPEDAASW